MADEYRMVPIQFETVGKEEIKQCIESLFPKLDDPYANALCILLRAELQRRCEIKAIKFQKWQQRKLAKQSEKGT